MLVEATIGKMVTRFGGARLAARHCTWPRYEPPSRATFSGGPRRRGAPVRAPFRGYFAGGPRLLGGPLDRVVAIFGFVAKRFPGSFRLVASASVLNHDRTHALRAANFLLVHSVALDAITSPPDQ